MRLDSSNLVYWEKIKNMCYFDKLELNFFFPKQKNPLPFHSTLALSAISQSRALGLQSGGAWQRKQEGIILFKGKKTKNKIPACQSWCTTLHYGSVCSANYAAIFELFGSFLNQLKLISFHIFIF